MHCLGGIGATSVHGVSPDLWQPLPPSPRHVHDLSTDYVSFLVLVGTALWTVQYRRNHIIIILIIVVVTLLLCHYYYHYSRFIIHLLLLLIPLLLLNFILHYQNGRHKLCSTSNEPSSHTLQMNHPSSHTLQMNHPLTHFKWTTLSHTSNEPSILSHTSNEPSSHTLPVRRRHLRFSSCRGMPISREMLLPGRSIKPARLDDNTKSRAR